MSEVGNFLKYLVRTFEFHLRRMFFCHYAFGIEKSVQQAQLNLFGAMFSLNRLRNKLEFAELRKQILRVLI